MENEIAEIKGRVDNLEEKYKAVEKRVEKHGEEIDEIGRTDKDTAVKMAIIEQSLIKIEANTEDIKKQGLLNEQKYESLKEQRDKDHIHDPKAKMDAYVQKAIMVAIGIFAGWLVVQLFPILN